MGYGLRTLNIASLNPDSTKATTIQQEIIKELTIDKIHIPMIQEALIAKDLNYMMDSYRIITSEGKRKETGVITGGPEVMINESIQQKT